MRDVKKTVNNKVILISIMLLAAIVMYFYFFHAQEKELEIFAVLHNEILVKEVGGNPEEWQASYTVQRETIVKDNKGNRLSFQDLKAGQVVIVRSDEQPFTLSNPPRLSAQEIMVIR